MDKIREDRVCLPPDAYNIGLLRDGGMPNCPCCQGTATTFSRFFPHSGIYQAFVHCAHCDVQVFKNARDHEEARRLAADTWSKRPVPRLATPAPDSEKLREAGDWLNTVPGVKPYDQFIAADRRLFEKLIARVIAASAITKLEAYDAGLLGDGGGGDVDWWQDYLRAELGRAHEFYSDQIVGASL